MTRVLLAGCSPTVNCLRREISAHLANGWQVCVNLHSLSLAEQELARAEYAQRREVTLVHFDPGVAEPLRAALAEGGVGFDAMVYPPHCYGCTEEVLLAVAGSTDLARRLRVIGCPNASIESFEEVAALAKSLGVAIVNLPDIHGESVAEYTISQFAFLSRRIGQFYLATGEQGEWPHERAMTESRSLLGRTLGVLGASGKDGSAVVRLARKMGMDVISEAPRQPEGRKKLRELGATIVEDFGQLLSGSDFISINCRNSPEVRGKIGARELERMKSGVIIVDPAGAEIFDEAALLAEFLLPAEQRRIGQLVFDMPYGGRRDAGAFQASPINAKLKRCGVLFTPRMAGYTLDTQEYAVTAIAVVVADYLKEPSAIDLGAIDSTDSGKAASSARLLQTIIGLARAAGGRAMALRRAGLDIAYKADRSPVTNADFMVEEFIRNGLRDCGYSFEFTGEEIGESAPQPGGFEVVVDGIDGTRNFRDGNYGWCTSVAVIVAGQTELAVVNDPVADIAYYALHGRGAFVQTTQGTQRLAAPEELPVDFSFSVGSFRIAGSSRVKHQIIEGIKHIGGREREWGCVGLSICAVARGGLGTFIQYSSPRHDHVAAVLIAQEAGAHLTVRSKKSGEHADLIVCHPMWGAEVLLIVDRQVETLAQL